MWGPSIGLSLAGAKALDAVNSPKDFMSGRRWIAERRHPDPKKLADPGVDLKSF